MRISLNLLRTLIDCNWSAGEIAERLTMSGSEVEAVELKGNDISGVVTARILSTEKLADSDKLSLCHVDYGKGNAQVVCGAPNVAAGQAVLFAPIGSKLPGGVTIQKAVIHGAESSGTILSEAELQFTDAADVIAELPEGTKPGIPLDEFVEYKDVIFELEITPNRPDCLSHVGIAREIQALGGGVMHLPDVTLAETAAPSPAAVTVAIDDPEGCPRYTARVIRNVSVGPSPLWLKMTVHNLGMRPINNIVDITNFVMMELGHPLHAFDIGLFKKAEVLVRRAREDEQFITLDNVVRKLNREHLLITDGVDPVAIAGIMGGLKSEVSQSTRNVLLESAYFDPVVIRRGSKALELSTESSRRFERGADPNMAPFANNRSCKLISELAGGEVVKGIVDAYPKPFIPVRIELRPSRVAHLLGKTIASREIRNILDGLEIKGTADSKIVAEQPSFRPDLSREVDLIEEIARIHGFDRIEPVFRPGGTLVTPESKMQRVKDKVRSYLVGAGMMEVFPLTLVDSRMVVALGVVGESVNLMNPISEELGTMRPSLIISILPVVRRNLGFREKNLALFEIGDVYHPSGKGELPSQKAHLLIALCGTEFPDFWGMRWRPRDLFSLKGVLEDLADHLRINRPQLMQASFFAFENDMAFEVYSLDKRLGYMGRLSNNVCEIADIKESVFIAELDFEEIVSNVPNSVVTRDLARFPSADRDIAIIVDENVMAEEVRQEIIRAADGLVDEIWIFDLYRGKSVLQGKKSLAYAIRYRLPDRTLTDEEVNEAQRHVIAALEKRFHAELRK
jgi:phenylalanyl-tRNA synthetase beta chain